MLTWRSRGLPAEKEAATGILCPQASGGKKGGATMPVQWPSRIRNLTSDFFLNEDVAECSANARLLLLALWTMTDREGRTRDKPKQIKVRSLPYDDVDIEPLLCELDQHHLIQRYQWDGERFIEILNWRRWQSPDERQEALYPDSNGQVSPNKAKDGQSGKSGAHSFAAPAPPNGTRPENPAWMECIIGVNPDAESAFLAAVEERWPQCGHGEEEVRARAIELRGDKLAECPTVLRTYGTWYGALERALA